MRAKHPAEHVSAKPSPQESGSNLQRRPGTTDPTWHVGEIKNDQSTGIGFDAFKANTAPASTGSLIGVVDANVDLPVVGVDETASLGGCLVYIVDITSGRVILLFNHISGLFEHSFTQGGADELC